MDVKIKVKKRDNFVTATLEPPAPYAAADIDVGSLRMNGAVGPIAGSAVLGDRDADGIPDLTVRFPRTLSEDTVGDDGRGYVTGEVGGACFEGSDKFKMFNVTSPAAGSTVASGGVTRVAWDTPEAMTVNSVAISYSLDDGSSWELVAEGLPNTGSYAWSVPNVTSSTARVEVALDDGTAEGAVAISDQFSIDAVVGVGAAEVAFALSGTAPNPSKGGAFNVRFSLPDAKRATLSLYDVSGRRLASREVGVMGAGRHVVTLGQRLPAGLYMVRLDREGMSLKTRATVVR